MRLRVLWVVASLVVLQFDAASIATVGVIVGVMFAVAATQQFVLAMVADSMRRLWAQFFIEKAYTLLVFAGIWALMHGITDIVSAFRIRSLRNVA